MRDTGLSAFNFVKGENTKLKSVNCEWFACEMTEEGLLAVYACRDT